MFSGEKSPSEFTGLPVGYTGNITQRERKSEFEYTFWLYGNGGEMQIREEIANIFFNTSVLYFLMFFFMLPHLQLALRMKMLV